MATNMLKKLLHISNILGCLTLLFAVSSCSNDNEPDVSYNKQAVTFKITTTDQAVTRSPGEDDLNENRLISVDYYFFADNADASKLKLHKTESGFDDVNFHECQLRLKDEELTKLFGSELTTGKTCYVYVVANMDAATRTAIDNMNNTNLNSVKTQSFQTKDISKNEAQKSFVMYGGGTVTLNVDGTKKTITGPDIRVERDAAKIDLFVTKVQNVLLIDAEGNVIKTNDAGEQIDEEGNVVPVADRTPVAEKWTSLPNQMLVMFYNGVNKSNIHSQINDGYHYLPTNDDKNVSNPDRCYFSLTGSNGGARELIKNEDTGNWEHAIPFYSYLSDWRENSGNKDYASYMILVLPWQQIDPSKGSNIGAPRATYYQIQTSTTDTYYENRYYQINIQIGILGSFEIPEPVKVTAQYMVVPWGDVDIPGSLREGRYLILETNKYTVNNQPSGSIPFVTSHKITQAYVTNVNYLVLRSFREENIPNTSDTDGTLTVNTYREYTSGNNGEGSQTIRNLQETFTVTTTNNILTLSHDIKPNQYTRYEVTVKIVNEAGLSEEAVFTIYPAIYTNKQNGGNSFINGYFGNVSSPVGGTWVLNRDGSYRVRQNRGGTAEAGDANSPYHIWAGGAYNYDGNNYDTEANTYGSLITGTPGLSTTFTRITVTSFTEDDEKFSIRDERQNRTENYTYKIADPRVASRWTSNDLMPFVVTGSSSYDASYTTQPWTGNYDAGKIKVGTAERDSIAPEFLVTSAWGRCNPNSISFEQAQKRCATYQEAGYPAGRWRLPTVAEISYIYTLQELDVINDLFNPTHTGGYWSSEGHPMRYQNGYPSLRTDYSQTSTDPVRCVYDLWYWGEEQQTQNEYHAMPTKNNN